MSKVVVKIPAKLVISGEHSVLYTGKAITCAISRYMVIKIKSIKRNVIKVKGNGFRVKHKLKDFLSQPFDNELELEIIRSFFLQANIKPKGLSISIKSKVPVNCGMGSSATIITGILFGLNEIFETNISRDDLIALATKLEDVCHGKSSGIDVVSVVNGGVLYFNNGKYEKIPHSFDEVWYINTGRSNFNTKDVVDMVSRNPNLTEDGWKEFDKIAIAIKNNIVNNKKICDLIVKNQQMLQEIGIVSSSVNEFIRNLLNYDIYAKVCGAGTIAELDTSGKCGVVAVFHKLSKMQVKVLKKLCHQSSWKLKRATIANAGLEIDVM